MHTTGEPNSAAQPVPIIEVAFKNDMWWSIPAEMSAQIYQKYLDGENVVLDLFHFGSSKKTNGHISIFQRPRQSQLSLRATNLLSHLSQSVQFHQRLFFLLFGPEIPLKDSWSVVSS